MAQWWRAAHIRYTHHIVCHTMNWCRSSIKRIRTWIERSEREKWEETSAKAMANYKVVMVHTIQPKIHWVWNTLWIRIQLSLDACHCRPMCASIENRILLLNPYGVLWLGQVIGFSHSAHPSTDRQFGLRFTTWFHSHNTNPPIIRSQISSATPFVDRFFANARHEPDKTERCWQQKLVGREALHPNTLAFIHCVRNFSFIFTKNDVLAPPATTTTARQQQKSAMQNSDEFIIAHEWISEHTKACARHVTACRACSCSQHRIYTKLKA